MTRQIVCVDGAGPTAVAAGEQRIEVLTTGSSRNVLVDADELVHVFLAELPPRCRDLFQIAGAIYAADARVSRGRITDAFNDAWRRDFSFHFGVHDLPFWSAPETLERLRSTVEFVSGDTIDFVFTAAKSLPASKQPSLPADFTSRGFRDADTVILLSGGLDSLAATLQARDAGRKPLLVSHRPATQLQARQSNVVQLLKARDTGWSFPHVSVLLNAVLGTRPTEFSQRTRSFLYASLAAITAKHLGLHDLRLCDNGVVTLNLPPNGQCVGTTLSRSTHPGYLRRLEVFLRHLTEDPALTVTNTLLDKTKREVVDMIAVHDPALVQETVSCAHTEGRTKGSPHCGLCTQCIDRRFATVAAGLEAHDLVQRYEHDIFTVALKEGRDRTHAENYVRFAHELRRYDGNPTEFAIERGADLAEALPEGRIDDFMLQVHELMQRHQRDVLDVLAGKITENATKLAAGSLPQHCLLRMTGASDVSVSPRERYFSKLAQILTDGLHITFQSAPPENERAMQDAGEAALKAADERLDREAPQVPFGCVSVRPDFSKRKDSEDELYIEFKLIKNKADRNRVSGEIAADVTQYPSRCYLLFVVFDSARQLADPSKMKRDVESKRANAMLVVVR